jgi:hypothetical protein
MRAPLQAQLSIGRGYSGHRARPAAPSAMRAGGVGLSAEPLGLPCFLCDVAYQACLTKLPQPVCAAAYAVCKNNCG